MGVLLLALEICAITSVRSRASDDPGMNLDTRTETARELRNFHRSRFLYVEHNGIDRSRCVIGYIA